MIRTLVVLALLLAVCQGQSFQLELANSTFTVAWTVAAPSISFKITSLSVSWVGVGWHKFGSTGQEDHNMYDADFAVAVFDGTAKLVSDRKADSAVNLGSTMPLDDTNATIGGKDDITIFDGLQTATSTTFSFTRLLDTGDVKGDWPLNQSGLYHLIFARGTTNTFGYHGHDVSQRGHWLVNFLTGENQACPAC